MASLLVQVKAMVRIALYVLGAFLLLQLWQDPSGAAQATTDFIGGIGHFFASVIDKIGEFAKGLTHDTSTPTTPTAP
jgi:hypothetical protein